MYRSGFHPRCCMHVSGTPVASCGQLQCLTRCWKSVHQQSFSVQFANVDWRPSSPSIFTLLLYVLMCLRFYERWKETEAMQAELLHFTLDDGQWEQDWAVLLSLANQPGLWCHIAYILHTVIIIYHQSVAVTLKVDLTMPAMSCTEKRGTSYERVTELALVATAHLEYKSLDLLKSRT